MNIIYILLSLFSSKKDISEKYELIEKGFDIVICEEMMKLLRRVFIKNKKLKANKSEGVIKIFSRADEVDKVIREIGYYAKKEGYGVVKRRHLNLALYEALANAILHGNGGNGNLKVIVRYSFREDELEIKVTDEGNGFDIRLNNINSENSTNQIGKGIVSIESFMERTYFNEKGNEITMVMRKSQNHSYSKRGMDLNQRRPQNNGAVEYW